MNHVMARKSIYFLVPYPHAQAPSQRFRFEQYFDLLRDSGFQFTVRSFYSLRTWKILHYEGNTVKKVAHILGSFLIRWGHVFAASRADVVFIHREVAPIGPPIFEWILTKVFRKKVIYDFDDAIWLPNFSEANTQFQRLKYYKKVHNIMRWSTTLSVGNAFLKNYASQFNSNVVINPTTIDTENYHNPTLFSLEKKSGITVIGWTGSHTTMKYLQFLEPILSELYTKYAFEFHVISNEKPTFEAPYLRFIRWKKETEIEDLMQFDLGVMPLENDAWSQGKCGFKALQYMALGIPAIVSPVGVNTEIVDHGTNGFIADTPHAWTEALTYFLANPQHAKDMSTAARAKIHSTYSVASNRANFLNFF